LEWREIFTGAFTISHIYLFKKKTVCVCGLVPVNDNNEHRH